MVEESLFEKIDIGKRFNHYKKYVPLLCTRKIQLSWLIFFIVIREASYIFNTLMDYKLSKYLHMDNL